MNAVVGNVFLAILKDGVFLVQTACGTVPMAQVVADVIASRGTVISMGMAPYAELGNDTLAISFFALAVQGSAADRYFMTAVTDKKKVEEDDHA